MVLYKQIKAHKWLRFGTAPEAVSDTKLSFLEACTVMRVLLGLPMNNNLSMIPKLVKEIHNNFTRRISSQALVESKVEVS